MTSGSLPEQIPPPSEPIGYDNDGRPITADYGWYLFLYNLFIQTISQGANVPASQSDWIDMVDLDAATTDQIQAYRQISNIEEQISEELSLADVMRIEKQALNIAQSASPEITFADIQKIHRELTNLYLLATDEFLQDPLPPAGAVIPIIPGVSPYTYTAIHDGTIAISGTASTNINIIRYGVSVPTGMTDGTIPMRKKDQIQISWSGATAPTMNYLPNK